MKNYIKEACVENLAEAVEAIKRGANRIELCDNLHVDGTTPSYGTIKYCCSTLSVPTMVLIRPRKGDFVYSATELEIMKEDIHVCKKLGAAGVVFGILTKNRELDEDATKTLVKLARPMQVTFHKAIDKVDDILGATVKLKNMGVERILSSGGEKSALKGYTTLNQMIKVGENEIKIVVAGKVTAENIREVSSLIRSTEFHGSRIV